MADKNLLESADMDKAKEAQDSMRRSMAIQLAKQPKEQAPAATATPAPTQENKSQTNDLAPRGLVGSQGGYVNPKFKNPFAQ